MSTLIEGKVDSPDSGQRKRHRWALQPFRTQSAWSGFVLTQTYPVAPENRASYREVVEAITARLPESRDPYYPEAFLQMDRIDFRKDMALVQQYAQVLGNYGLGIYPQAPPPTAWKKEEFTELFPPQKLRPLAHDIVEVDGGPEAIVAIRQHFLGSGAYVQAFCTEPGVFYRAATAQFKPLIVDKLIRTFPYHAPLLQRSAVENATPEQLEAWTCGSALYMRESIEDNGLLFLLRRDTAPLLHELAEGNVIPDATFLLG